ncbi:fungal-specific transcription factor domain-containing protein [Xylaria digitata]|nr:fungal-specific transcription factor domain-containing protein [Xylaria digitata]
MYFLGVVENRVYRSHSQPACIPCRKRKSRCKLDSTDLTTCLLCKLHGNECVFPDSPASAVITRVSASHRRTQKRAAKQNPGNASRPWTRPSTSASTYNQHYHAREALAQHTSTPPTTESLCPLEVPFAGSPAPTASPDGDESHVIGPVQSPDAQLIANYLFNNPSIGSRASRMIITRPDHLHSGQRTVLFNVVRRHPLGHIPTQSLTASICEIVSKLLEPHCENLIDIYFSKVHQCFPILDERTFKLQYTTQKEKISPVLLTLLYAQSIVYWRNSSTSSNRHYPDLRFIWNKANEALNSELYASPGMSAIAAILLNVAGRPLTAMIGNGVLLGSAISLAHSLGLNRNCLDWNISSSEKNLRTRLWWAIVIFDKWFSVTHGTPQQLRASQHDVPSPGLAAVADGERATNDFTMYSTFEALARLSEVLETYLDHVFNLNQQPGNSNSKLRVLLEKKLAQWEDHLPSELRRAILRGTNMSIPGSANLRLSYLYIRLLTQKLGVDDVKETQPMNSEDLDHRLMHARQAAESIVLFVQELDDRSLRDFWLSLNAFALSGTVAFLFRCALESEQGVGGVAQSRYLKLARDLVVALQAHQRRMNWDLGNICVAQYATVLENIANNDRPLETISDLQQIWQSDSAELDQMFLNDWDMFQTDGACAY